MTRRLLGFAMMVGPSIAWLVACSDDAVGVARLEPSDPQTSDGDTRERDGGAVGCEGAAPLARLAGALYLVADVSASMEVRHDKLAAEVGGITAFVREPSSMPLHAGLLLHPAGLSSSCAASEYAPRVPFGPLADGGGEVLVTALSSAPAQGPSMWAPAIEAGIATAIAEATAHPERRVAMVFLSDETSTQCVNGVRDLAALMKRGTDHGPPVRTFVIGMFEAAKADAQGTFVNEAMAAAGGTSPPALLGQPRAADVLAALRRARDETACSLAVDKAAKTVLSSGGQVHVATASGVFPATRVKDRASCPAAIEPAPGDPLTPAEIAWFEESYGIITLCPAACRASLADPTGIVEARCP